MFVKKHPKEKAMKYNNELLSWVLPFLTGEAQLDEQVLASAKKDKSKLAILTTCALIYRDAKNEISPKKISENIFEKKAQFYFTDFSDKIEAYIGSSLDEDLSSIGLNGYTFTKIEGDDFGVIFDADDNPVLYLKFFADTRCPWLSFPNDKRKVQFQVTFFDEPDNNGFVKRLDGWGQKPSTNGRKSPYTYRDTGLTVSAFDRVPAHILALITGTPEVQDEELNKMTLTISDRKIFRDATTAVQTDDEHSYQIVKEAGSESGEVSIDGNVVGTVSLVRVTPVRYKAMVNITSQLPEGIGKNHAINMLQAAVVSADA